MLSYKRPNRNKYINIYKGAYLKKLDIIHYKIPSFIKLNKVVVFDLDETIGSFRELFILWNSLENICREHNIAIIPDQSLFNNILDLYPEFLRYEILTVFEYLMLKKKTNQCSKIYLYTNNTGSPKFPSQIQKYIDYKLNTQNLVDKIISAFKINNVIIEPLRTTIHKTYSDFIRCSVLPKTTEICFIDDTFHEKMKNNKVYYIQPKPYKHNLSVQQIIDRLLISNIVPPINNVPNIHDIFKTSFDQAGCIHYKKTIPEMEVDIIVTQKILFHIKDFFYLTTRKQKTKKLRLRLGNFTRKNTYVRNNGLSNIQNFLLPSYDLPPVK